MLITPMHNRFAQGFVESDSSSETIDRFSSRVLDQDWLDRDLAAIHGRADAARAAALAGAVEEAARAVGGLARRLWHAVADNYRCWRTRERAAEELFALDDRALAELGLNRADIPFVVSCAEAQPARPPRDTAAPVAANRNDHRRRDAA
jgi:uncharacterized protein YjiS (DUF1127 family)